MTKLKFTLRGLHEGQWEVFLDPSRFKVVAAGRRWGKSFLGLAMCIARAWEGGQVWWISPNYPIGQIAWRGLLSLVKSLPGVTVKIGDLMVTFPTGGWIQFKSADSKDGLRGEGLDLVILDEAAFIKKGVWSKVVAPALIDHKGSAAFLSTPFGLNWFHDLTIKAPDLDDWTYWHKTTFDNPLLDPAEIEGWRQTMTERDFQEEVLAAFNEEGGSVFRYIKDAATATLQNGPAEGRRYVMGVDLARHVDFTTIVVMDGTTRAVACIDRFNEIDWKVQVGRVTALADRFDVAAILIDETGVGGPVVEELRRATNRAIYGITFNNANKLDLVQSLALAFEQHTITIPDDEVFVGEHMAYQCERLPSGLLRYGAPEGLHDDYVTGMMLAHHGLQFTESHKVTWS